MSQEEARSYFFRIGVYFICLLVRTVLIILPIKYYDYGSAPLVIIYMGIFSFFTLLFAYLLHAENPRLWWPRLPHYMLYFLILIVAVMTLYLPLFHITSILLCVDLCISYTTILQSCPFSRTPETWWT